MRLGVSTLGSDPAKWREVAREAEAIGFDVLHLADHLVDGLPPPLTSLAIAAEATEVLHVGTLVLAVDFRHPAILAREAAMLADLSGGRFELGLGAGHMKPEWDALGLPFDPAPVRAARLDEALTILRRLLAGDAVTHDGDHYTLLDHRCWPVPSRPVPILVGGNGDRVLRVAAAQADLVGFTGFAPTADGSGVNLTHFTAAGLEDRLAHVRSAAKARAGGLRFQVLVQAVIVTDDRRAAAQPIADRFGAPVEDILDSPFVLIGTHQQLAEQLTERSERFGIETWTVFADRPGLTDQRLDTLAPVIELLATGS
ncbi:LLM class F420-dependent oxidoreductase [soil metagenome]